MGTITEAVVMDKDYECSRRVRVTCPRCGGTPSVAYNDFSICHEKNSEGYHCNTVWGAMTAPIIDELSDDVRMEIGDDSRLYRHDRWLIEQPRDPFFKIYYAVKGFRETGRVPDFPGMEVDGEREG